MTTIFDRAPALLKTAAELAALQGHTDEAKILKAAKASVVETGYDNWNGGITFFTLALEIPLKIFSKIERDREKFEKSIQVRMRNIIRSDSSSDITEIIITPTLLDKTTDASDDSESIVVPSFWEPNYFRLFISHPSAVKNSAHSLKQALAEFQIAAFVAHDDIEPSLEWQPEIETALRTMDALVAVITPDFVTSKWCDQEVGYALGRGKFVIPLTTADSPHGFLGKIQALKVKGLKIEIVAQKISEILLQNPSTSPRMIETLVESLASSGSYATTRRVLGQIESVPHLTQSQIARLLSATDENRQVRDAIKGSSMVPERIRTLAKKFAA